MAIEYNFTLDMDRSKRDNNIAYARTGDVDSVVINASLVLNGSPYTPSGTNAFFECITPNGHSVRASASKSGSTVSAEIPSAAFQAAGVINVAYFRFETGSSDNPTYVESTEPFAIIVREGIGNNIDAGDYIEEWRQLADSLDETVKEVQQKATQAEAAITEQKEEVDELKTQAQTAIAQDTVAVENAKTQAISDINATKEEVADAAKDVTAAGDQAISQFKTNSQQAINSFNTNGTSAINQFDTNANDKLDEVDGMITEVQGDVDAAITQLESETQNAIKVAQDALDGTTAANLQNAINRTLKLDIADMTNIPNNASLSSFTNVGSYCCKTAAAAATIGDCPIDDSPFNMYVFSSATSGQVMQLVVPIDLQGKPTAEWHVRFGTSSAMDSWSVIGGGADIAAGLGIDVTGDAQKTVALDTTAFYQHHEATDIIQGSTEVTGGGRIKELTVYGNTRQNLWVNPNSTVNGITAKANADGSVTLSGTATDDVNLHSNVSYQLRPGSTYYMSCSPKPNGFYLGIAQYVDGAFKSTKPMPTGGGKIVIDSDVTHVTCVIYGIASGRTATGTYRIMLNEGSTAEPWCQPGLNGVEELSIVTAGKNLLRLRPDLAQITTNGVTFTPQDDGGILVDGTALETAFFSLDFNYTQKITPAPPAGTTVTQSGDTDEIELNVDVFLTDDSVVSVTTSVSPTGTIPSQATHLRSYIYVKAGDTVDNVTVYPQLELGSTATPYEPPAVTTTTIDLDGHALNSLPDGTRDELRIDGTGAVTLVQRVGVATAPTAAGSWLWNSDSSRGMFALPATSRNKGTWNQNTELLCDKLPPATSVNDESYAVTVNDAGFAKNPAITSAATAATVAGGATYLYPLATPQEVELPGVSMPDLASPDYTIYASSNMPAEIEADVVKVDYLPASDVYTKEEVDKKIEDAGGMPDIVPVSQGGTGVTTAAAERNRLGLGNTTGAVPVANGGTGAANAKAAQYNLLSNMNIDNGAVDDNVTVMFAYGSGSTTLGAVYKRKLQVVWDWIASKIRSVFGFDSSNVLDVEHGGTGLNDYPAMLVDLESTSTASPYQSAPRPGVTGTLPVTRGGTGASSAANARTNIEAAYGISSAQGSLSDSTKVTSDLSSSANTNFTLSSLWSNWLEDKISTFLGTYGTFKKIYQNTDQSMTAQSSAVLQGFQNGKILILICRLYVPSYTTTTDYESSTQAWTGLTFPSQIPTAMTPTSVLSDWTTLTPMYQCGMVSSGGSSNWNNRLVLQQVKLASNGRGLTGNVNTFDTVATNKTPNQVWVNAYMFLVA